MKILVAAAFLAVSLSGQAFSSNAVQFQVKCGSKTKTVTTSSLRVTSASRANESRLNRALKTWNGGKYARCTVVPGSISL